MEALVAAFARTWKSQEWKNGKELQTLPYLTQLRALHKLQRLQIQNIFS